MGYERKHQHPTPETFGRIVAETYITFCSRTLMWFADTKPGRIIDAIITILRSTV